MTEGTPSDPSPGSGMPGASGMGQGWESLGTLLSGIIVWGGAGWLVDHWLGTSLFFPIGVLVGLAAAVYLVFVRAGEQAEVDQHHHEHNHEHTQKRKDAP